jgi:hypothetical protein
MLGDLTIYKVQGEDMTKLIHQIQTYIVLSVVVLLMSVVGACDKGPDEPGHPTEAGRPDLTFTGRYNFEYQRTLPPTGNDLYTLVVEVKNEGTASVQNVQVVAYSKGPGIQGNRPALDNNGYYSIPAGETIRSRFQFIFEKQFGGDYEFTITVDQPNAVMEKNESNNKLVFSRKF